ncbi:stage II sporulation protein D [Paenibacillus cremeus]|uniref:Stage II sporulation protein D n=1 Tax=Paenibacillus cremeus TaxID=2163881 RepID=A0A559KAZ8_9BACL|nr:stage II sporulation protein D [Paenibacillus cremeus]TVY09308.1 stage II sporulation protein D [Paenibacillus cremeus]
MKYKLQARLNRKWSPKQKAWLRWFAVWIASFTTVVVLVPGLLVRTLPNSDSGTVRPGTQEVATASAPSDLAVIPVYLAKEKKTVKLGLEQYVKGVVAAEMPIEFEPEALKAQAMAARTYIVRRLLDGDKSNVPVSSEALVTDTTTHQAFVSDEELKSRWSGDVYTANVDKLNKAVEGTKDLILTYQHAPIEASFFSTSNGYTENSEDYWNETIPYLRSVPSPWDVKLSPRYKETVTITAKELQQKLGLPAAVPVTSGGASAFKVIEKSQGQRIKRLSINGKLFTGREVREKLGLNSSQFQWAYNDGEWKITTFGYGHGVGMSQWGANGMAKEGRKAEDIVKYFYKGIEVEPAANLLKGKLF